MNARVWKLVTEPGAVVEAEGTILILEAMKMEISVKAPPDKPCYKVSSIIKNEGDMVSAGDVVALLEPSD